ncbi:hypothetical protein EST38_g522 [Candolleomyces aberdarensis]|uniref:Alpha-1,3-glucosyltransferase n=1 Tax=Candolleomyces aberdarensis TaxID=2316362 RepID=A0A4Q2E1U7_9AGAR|nr:hypothetical protein EST38_g522 [Candolleomyces aberdarensis]
MSRWNGYDAEPPSSMPTIHAPTPRRHLIDTSESQHWLGSPPLSPVSSTRAVSPFATHFPSNTSPTSATSTSIRGKKAPDSPTRRRTFSSLYNTDNPPKHLRQRQTSNASISSTYTVHGAANTVSLHKALLRSKYTQAHGETEHASLGRRWIRSMHKRGLRTWVIPGAIAFATLVKLCLGVGSYSGEATPPMYGDYEAQRHWMEITTHLPFREWYTYDLQYWGLDYPPLTAYVSWLCGLVGSWANPTWFALDASRGIETPGSKLYMRLTVVFFDMLVYIPALIMFVKTWQGTRSKRTQEQALLLLLLQPALLLIDHGHFQYNSVMLGFTLLSINFFATGNDLVAAVFFVLSLGFKQMALYYAPAIGSYLLAKCIYLGPKKGFTLFTRLAVTTVASFAILFLPFFLPGLAPSPLHILHPIQRIFPFSRGLFEDKVANFWCASNVVIKWRKLAGDGDTGRSWLVRTSALLTALGFLPGVLGLLRAGWIMRIREDGSTQKARELDTTITNIAEEGAEKDVDDSKNDNPPPFLPLLSYALLTSSMSFFLFSFQVHEKTILLPLLPLTLLMSGAQPGTALHSWGALGNNVAVFSMWPLLKRDGLAVPYIATVVLWNRLVGYNPLTNLSVDFRQLFSLAVYSAAIALHALELVIAPPARYPDLFPVLNVLISTPVFVLIWLWSIKCGVEVAWALGGLSSSSSSGVTAGQSLGTTTGGPGRTGSLVPEDRDVAELEVPLEGPASVLLSEENLRLNGPGARRRRVGDFVERVGES